MNYTEFLHQKTQLGRGDGFEPVEIPSFLKPFQAFLTDWAIRQGRAEIMADCGLGKTPMLLTWADNIVRHTNGRVLIVVPLAVAGQTIREAEKFGFKAEISRNGVFSPQARIVVTNYEQLHHFDPKDFDGCVCDESSRIKDADSKTKAAVTEFMRTIRFRLLCTATAAPNDYDELGTSAEALGEMGYSDMLTRFFRQRHIQDFRGWSRQKYDIRPHAEHDFWRWVCSWARACRKPSDLGFDDSEYVLPELIQHEHVIESRTKRDGYLLDMPARTIQEQGEERRRTIQERCEKVADLVNHDQPAICWGHLNPECDLLEKMIPGSIQVSGKDSDESKEEKLLAFISGEARVMVSKPKMFGFGLNLQCCGHQTFFPSHSFEQGYQAIRRSWRFGRKGQVVIDMVSSEGEAGIIANWQRKSAQMDLMFSKLVSLMNDHLHIERTNGYHKPEELPSWLSQTR
jgi:hypothetical protein